MIRAFKRPPYRAGDENTRITRISPLSSTLPTITQSMPMLAGYNYILIRGRKRTYISIMAQELTFSIDFL
jgi:hypothetical protein